MSDTDSAKPSRRGCCCKLLLALAVLALATVGYGVYVYRAARATAPLAFQPFRYGPLERSLLTAKFEFLELPSKLITGGPTRVVLSERELNALLFGDASHTDAEKARVRLLPGDRLGVDVTTKLKDGAYLNVEAEISLTIGPGVGRLEVHEGRVGDYALGPVTRPLVEHALNEGLNAELQRDAKLGRLHGLRVVDGKAELVYQPK